MRTIASVGVLFALTIFLGFGSVSLVSADTIVQLNLDGITYNDGGGNSGNNALDGSIVLDGALITTGGSQTYDGYVSIGGDSVTLETLGPGGGILFSDGVASAAGDRSLLMTYVPRSAFGACFSGRAIRGSRSPGRRGSASRC